MSIWDLGMDGKNVSRRTYQCGKNGGIDCFGRTLMRFNELIDLSAKDKLWNLCTFDTTFKVQNELGFFRMTYPNNEPRNPLAGVSFFSASAINARAF